MDNDDDYGYCDRVWRPSMNGPDTPPFIRSLQITTITTRVCTGPRCGLYPPIRWCNIVGIIAPVQSETPTKERYQSQVAAGERKNKCL